MRQRAQIISGVIATVAVLSLSAFALRTPAPPTEPSLPAYTAPSTPAPRPVAAFLGDSYTGGSDMGGTGDKGWPAIVATKLGWVRDMYAVGGSGFVSKGQGAPFAERVAKIVADRPNIVIVEGGHNDVGTDAATVTAAAGNVLAALHKGLPDASIVVLGPVWPSGDYPANLTAIRDGLRNEASKVGATFVDPMADRWFAGTRRALIGSDGTHPTDAGHQHIADELLPELRRLKI